MSRSERSQGADVPPQRQFNLKWILIAVAIAFLVAGSFVIIDRLGVFQAANNKAETQSETASSNNAATTSTSVRTETITYDSWTVSCRITTDQKSKRSCSGLLQLADKSNGRVLLSWIIARDNQGVLRTVMHTPTGVQILNGVELKFGDTPPRKLGYTICDPQHCEATTVVDETLKKYLLSNSQAVVTILATDGRGINFNLPIKGVDKVLNDVSSS